jgi:ATP-dependent protease HslVU (ClpYQ) ATPase subunit
MHRLIPLALGLALLAAGCSRGKERNNTTDLQAVREELKKQVAQGELTEAEAQVKLAEAFAKSKERERRKARDKVSPELEALGAQIKEQLKNGELTEEEARAQWIKAKEQIGTEAKGEAAEEQ